MSRSIQADLLEQVDDTPLHDKLARTDEIDALLRLPSTVLLLNVSGGKDGAAMARVLTERARAESWPCEIKLIHSDLGRMEWHESLPECERLAEDLGLELVVVRHAKHDLLGAIEERMQTRPDAPPFPSSAARYCTAGWKRDVISRWIRHNIPDGSACVCALGLRAEESPARARKPVSQVRTGANAPSKGRYVLDWNPILSFRLPDVWQALGYSLAELAAIQVQVQAWRDEGVRGAELMSRIQAMGFRAHPAYALGNERVSCAMCVLACKSDLRNGMEFRPDTYRRLVEIERRSGFAFQQNKPLSALAESHEFEVGHE